MTHERDEWKAKYDHAQDHEVAEAYLDWKSAEKKRLWPLAEIGIKVRNRYFEQLKPRKQRDQGLVQLGHEAAHYGQPIPDSRLYYLSKEGGGRDDPEMYEKENVVAPFVVFQHSDNKEFVDILGWHSSTRSFLRAKLGVFFSISSFESECSALTKKFDRRHCIQGLLGVFMAPEKNEIERLREEYGKAFIKHQEAQREKQVKFFLQ